MRNIILITGGARSGKSRYAEERARDFAAPYVYIATAEARDDEMAARIRDHRRRRGEAWRTVDAPLDLAEALDAEESRGVVLIDCLTLWLSNLIEAERNVGKELEQLTMYLARSNRPVLLVTNEVGLGIVPDNALARRFRDEAGRMNQRIAAVADEVVLMVSGLPVRVKPV